jgi:hypothetical protein
MRRADFRLPADGSRAACLRNWLRKSAAALRIRDARAPAQSVSWLMDFGGLARPPDHAQACAIWPGRKPDTTGPARQRPDMRTPPPDESRGGARWYAHR